MNLDLSAILIAIFSSLITIIIFAVGNKIKTQKESFQKLTEKAEIFIDHLKNLVKLLHSGNFSLYNLIDDKYTDSIIDIYYKIENIILLYFPFTKSLLFYNRDLLFSYVKKCQQMNFYTAQNLTLKDKEKLTKNEEIQNSEYNLLIEQMIEEHMILLKYIEKTKDQLSDNFYNQFNKRRRPKRNKLVEQNRKLHDEIINLQRIIIQEKTASN